MSGVRNYPKTGPAVDVGLMYESLQCVREVMVKRLEEIDGELAQDETLVRERDMLRRTLNQPPFVQAGGGAPEGNGTPRTRARRGENIQRVLELVQAQPDATVSERIERHLELGPRRRRTERGTEPVLGVLEFGRLDGWLADVGCGVLVHDRFAD
jgi:hypothetical protein